MGYLQESEDVRLAPDIVKRVFKFATTGCVHRKERLAAQHSMVDTQCALNTGTGCGRGTRQLGDSCQAPIVDRRDHAIS